MYLQGRILKKPHRANCLSSSVTPSSLPWRPPVCVCTRDSSTHCKPIRGFPGGSTVKNPPAMQETWVRSLGREDLWSRAWKPIPVFLPGESHGQKNLEGYSPRGHKESDMTEATEHSRTNQYTVFIFSNVYKSDFNRHLTQPDIKSTSLVLRLPDTLGSQENQVAHAGTGTWTQGTLVSTTGSPPSPGTL